MLSPMLGVSSVASRLAPPQFRAYLRIFSSAQAPDVAQEELDPGNGHMVIPDPLLSTQWTPIEGIELTLFILMTSTENVTRFLFSCIFMYPRLNSFCII